MNLENLRNSKNMENKENIKKWIGNYNCTCHKKIHEKNVTIEEMKLFIKENCSCNC
jgi:hypothetical protein